MFMSTNYASVKVGRIKFASGVLQEFIDKKVVTKVVDFPDFDIKYLRNRNLQYMPLYRKSIF